LKLKLKKEYAVWDIESTINSVFRKNSTWSKFKAEIKKIVLSVYSIIILIALNVL